MSMRRSLVYWLIVTAVSVTWRANDASAQESQKIFRAGAASVDITPALGVRMDGPISQVGGAKRIHDPLHARGLVLDDGSTRLAIVIVDLTMISRRLAEAAKQLIAKQTGLPAECVLIAATHTHNAPRMSDLWDQPAYLEYGRDVTLQIAECVGKAHANLAPAVIGWGSFDRPDLVKTRRWIWQPGKAPANPFGIKGETVRSLTLDGPNSVKAAGPVDPQFFLLSVRHADGSPLALLGNYNVHYAGGGRRAEVSADYFGYFSARIAELLANDSPDDAKHPPIVGLMSNGNSGSTTSASRIIGKREPYEVMRLVGYDLAEQAHKLSRSLTYHNWLPLAARMTDLELAVRRPDQKLLEWAKTTWAQAQPKLEAGQQLTWTEIYARENLLLSEWPATNRLPLQVLAIGKSDGLAITSGPCEMFAETGLWIKEQSPFASTFNIELANGTAGYLPPPRQHEWGGYETWPARSSHLEIEAEPKIRAALLSLLKQLAN